MARATMTFEGNVGATVDFRFTQGGKVVAKFNVACTDRRKGATGEWEDGDTMWVQVVTFGALAESVAEGVGKGMKVVVQGRPKLETWQDREGKDRTTLVVMADWVGIQPKAVQPKERPAGAAPAQDWGVPQEAPF
jgi:single-strand DNA-binding protein